VTGTPRQMQALEFITTCIAGRGFAPAYIEIPKALNLKSKSGVHRLVGGLNSAD
jgi:SOS-response transcriptional repressor LexA